MSESIRKSIRKIFNVSRITNVIANVDAETNPNINNNSSEYYILMIIGITERAGHVTLLELVDCLNIG